MQQEGRSFSTALDLKAFHWRMEGSETERAAERCDVSSDDLRLDLKASLNSFNLRKFHFLPAFLHLAGSFEVEVKTKKPLGVLGRV